MNVKWVFLCVCLCLAAPIAAFPEPLSSDPAPGRYDDEALHREASRYRSQKVANPIALHARLTRRAMADLRGTSNVAVNIHRIMRVGDRIVFEPGGKYRTIWKRNGKITPEFREAVAALLKGENFALPWQAEPERRRASVSINGNTLSGLAFALHRARVPLPLVALSAGQFGNSGETVQRTRGDGTITLLADGGEGLKLPGRTWDVGPHLKIAHIAAGNGPLELRWRKAPEKLLVVGDAGTPFRNPSNIKNLLLHEKRILSIARGARVKSFIRLSSGPDYDGWKRKEFAPSGPLASQLDLSRDEVGPHEQSGNYRRVWIVTYLVDGGLTQRQVEASYSVIDKKKKFDGDRFLRRDGLGAGGK